MPTKRTRNEIAISHKRTRYHLRPRGTPFDLLNDDCMYTLLQYIVAVDLRTALALVIAYPRAREPFYINVLRNWVTHAVLEPLGAPLQCVPNDISIITLYDLARRILKEYRTPPTGRPDIYQHEIPHENAYVGYAIAENKLFVGQTTWVFLFENVPPYKNTSFPNGLRHLANYGKTVHRINDTVQFSLLENGVAHTRICNDTSVPRIRCNSAELGNIVFTSTQPFKQLSLKLTAVHFIPEWLINAHIKTVVIECDDMHRDVIKSDTSRQPEHIIGLRKLLANATRIGIASAQTSNVLSRMLACLPDSLSHLTTYTYRAPLSSVDWSPINKLTQLKTLHAGAYQPRKTPLHKTIQFDKLTQLRAVQLERLNNPTLHRVAQQLATLPHLKAIYLFFGGSIFDPCPTLPIQVVDAPKLQVFIAHGYSPPKEYPSILTRSPNLRIFEVCNHKEPDCPDYLAPFNRHNIENTHQHIQYINIQTSVWWRSPHTHFRYLQNVGLSYTMNIDWDQDIMQELKTVLAEPYKNVHAQ